jgi:hypothetical protein
MERIRYPTYIGFGGLFLKTKSRHFLIFGPQNLVKILVRIRGDMSKSKVMKSS